MSFFERKTTPAAAGTTWGRGVFQERKEFCINAQVFQL